MKSLLTFLVFLLLRLYASAQVPNLLGTWYVIEYASADSISDEKQDRPSAIFRMVLEMDHKATIVRDSINSVLGSGVEFATWYHDSGQSQLVVFTTRSYRFDYKSEPMIGSVSGRRSNGRIEIIGRCFASRERTKEWDSTRSRLAELRSMKHDSPQQIKSEKPNNYVEAEYYHRGSSSTTNACLKFVTTPATFEWGQMSFALQPSVFSFTLHLQDHEGYYSSNSLIPLASLIALVIVHPNIPPRSDWYGAAFLTQGLGNFDVNVSLAKFPVAFVVAQSTDCFFFYKNSKILPESKFGFMLNTDFISLPLQARVCYCIPWFHGYSSQRENHLSFMLGCAL